MDRYGGYPPRKGDNIVTALEWIYKGFSEMFINLYTWLKKIILRLTTGTGELERILNYNTKHNDDMTNEVRRCLFTSTVLGKLIDNTLRQSFPVNVKQITTQIITQKNIHPSSGLFRSRLMPNLMSSLHALNGANYASFTAEEMSNIKYDSSNSEHERKLELLWSNLMPGRVRVDGRISKEWGDIGFQGKDPSTDFRGLGLLGLESILYFSSKYPDQCLDLLQDTQADNGFPFAITGINITRLVLILVKTRILDEWFYSVVQEQTGCNESSNEIILKERALVYFHEVFCIIFQRFSQYWFSCNPTNVLAFNIIIGEFRSNIEKNPNLKNTSVY